MKKVMAKKLYKKNTNILTYNVTAFTFMLDNIKHSPVKAEEHEVGLTKF